MAAIPTAQADATPERKLPGAIMRLVAAGLKARGFDVNLPEHEDERRMSIKRWGGHCDLSVDDFGFVEWECLPWATKEPDLKITADITAFLLSGKVDGHPSQGNGHNLRGTSFMAIAGQELRARGFSVGLEVYQDNRLFEFWAEILIKNVAASANAMVGISDDGSIFWECDYPYEVTEITDSPTYFAVLENHRELTDSIVATVAHAVALASGIDTGDVDG
jgi:hypothetical protein